MLSILHITPAPCLFPQSVTFSHPALTHWSKDDSFPWQPILVSHIGPEPEPNWPYPTSTTASGNPSWRHTTSASSLFQPILHTACQTPYCFISTLPMWENLLPLNLTAAVSVKIKQKKYLWRIVTVAIAADFCEKVSTIHCCENHVQGIDTETGIST